MNRLPAIFLALSAMASAADKTTSMADADLPQPFDSSASQVLLLSSPFTRELNHSNSLLLTGIASISGKSIATIFDKATMTSYVVSDEPNVRGWRLVEASVGLPLDRAVVKVMIGSELVTLRYGSERRPPDALKRSQSVGQSDPSPDAVPRREYARPSDEDRQRFESFSDKAKEKVRDFFRDNRERLANATPEERISFVRQTFERIQKEDRDGR